MRRIPSRHGLLLALAIANPCLLSAQVTTATFYGLVTDPTNAAVATASITLTNQATGHERRATSSEIGEFSFQFLESGRYTLRIQASGFRSYEASGLDLRSGQNFRRAYALELGAVSDQITVATDAPLLNAVSSEQRESISSTQATELPVARRTLSNLMGLSAGIAPGAQPGMLVFNGNAFKSGSYTMDGIDASGDQKQGSANFADAYISVVSLEAVEEVQVVKGVFSAEYSRTQAGNVNVVTKSGTNQVHGSLFSLFNSDELQARNPFLQSVPGSTFNQFGGSIGGPIQRNRLFYFATYEGYRERAFRTVQGVVPTQFLRDEAIRAVPAYKPYLDGFPLPNQPTAPGALNGQFFGADSFRSDSDHVVVKGDYWLSDRMRINATLVRDRPTSLTPRLHFASAQSFEGNADRVVGSSRVDLQACKLEYSIVSPK